MVVLKRANQITEHTLDSAAFQVPCEELKLLDDEDTVTFLTFIKKKQTKSCVVLNCKCFKFLKITEWKTITICTTFALGDAHMDPAAGYFNGELIPPLNLMIISVYVLDENAHDVEFSDISAYI